MLGYLILRRIETRIGRKINDTRPGTILDLNPRGRERFAECCFSKLCWGGHSDSCGLGSNAERQAARKRDQGGPIRIRDEVWRLERRFGAGRSSSRVIHEFDVGSLRREFDSDGVALLRTWRANKIDDVVIDHNGGHDDVRAPLARAVREK